MLLSDVPFDEAPYRFSGNVYGALLNHRDALAALGTAVDEPPYKAPPRAVVLYVKPRNTLVGPGADIAMADDAAELEVGASLGLVIGRTACRVREADALEHLAGYTIVNDISVPHASFYRPQIRFKARDRSCAIGPCVVARRAVADPGRLEVRVHVDGRLVHENTTSDLIRPVARLLAEVSDFMTLLPGDVLMAGVAHGAPKVRAGQHVAIEIDGLGRLENRVVEMRGIAA
jgi:5-oxopent-3-ene-1,2,5-tricarboxylate decarboxylase / 2-hydroxyhepta-2,4-diene-1,7-dioate isomerase